MYQETSLLLLNINHIFYVPDVQPMHTNLYSGVCYPCAMSLRIGVGKLIIDVCMTHMSIFNLFWTWCVLIKSLQWRHNDRDGVSNHQHHYCLLNRLFRRTSKKTSKLRVTGLCEGNSSVTGKFPTQRASNAENVSIWWLHHVLSYYLYT